VVEVWIAFPRPWRLLLLRRRPSHGGFWQGVSGRVEAFDASLEAAARREMREETGLVAAEILDLGPLLGRRGVAPPGWVDFRGAVSGTWFRKRALAALLAASADPRAVRLSEEHDALRLVAPGEAEGLLRWDANRAEVRALEALLQGRGGGEGTGG
jgi:8-oxo-dGTP pyrophosphatase MutT (NUDIX family)